MKKKHIIAMMTLCTMAAGCAEKAVETQTPEPKKEVVPAIELSNMDTEINPAEDFFRFVNDEWLKNNPIPEEYSTYGAFTEIDQHNELLIKDIIDEVSQDTTAQQGSVAQKIRDFYNAGMDTIAIDERGYSELMPYFEMIDNLNDKAQLAELLGKLHSDGIGGFFGAGGSPDPKNAEMVIMHLYQGGLSLTDREDYLAKESKEMRDKYVEHVAKMFELTGTEPEAAADKAKRILRLETQLATNSMTRVDRRDPDKTYNMRTLVELQKTMPNFDWNIYFKNAGAPMIESLNVGMPDFMAAMDKIILNTDLNTIKDYLRWKVIHGSASMLSSDLDAENFSFYGNYLYGQEVQQPRWRRILDATSGCLGEAIGQLYVEKHFPAEAKERMLNLVGNLRVALGERIKNLDWMSEPTKEKALKKLAAVNMKLAYPDKWKDMSELEITRDSYVRNMMNYAGWNFKRMISRYGQPVDRTEWHMQPQTYNAYYSPSNNEICIPGCNIIVPGFDGRMPDDAILYAIIGGSTFGHEVTHGFDDTGCNYDAEGNLTNWWTEEDKAKFQAKTKMIVEQFNNYEVVDGLHINGENTQGENIADLGGLIMGFEAFKKTDQYKNNEIIGGFTPAQRYFLGHAQAWMMQFRPEALATRVKSDEHSPAKWRVLGPLSNTVEFYEAFDVKEGDKMWRPENERVKIW